MNISQFPNIIDLDINNNYCFNSFPQLKEIDFSKEFLFTKDLQEKHDNFLLESTLNPSLSQMVDTSMANSTNETALALIKGESFDSSFVSNEISQDKLTKESNLASNKNVVFRTEVNNNEFETKFEYGDKLLMNRLSARKSRLKKKKYVKCLEEETARLKNEILLKKNAIDISKKLNLNLNNEDKEKNSIFFSKLILMEQQEKEVKLKGQKSQTDIMNQYENLQKTLLREMLIRQIHCFVPLRLKILGEKNIKLIEANEDDELSVIINKINENIDKIKNYMNAVPKNRIKSIIKLHEIYKKIKNFVDGYQQLFAESFNY
jgi:hypothetical protein